MITNIKNDNEQWVTNSPPDSDELQENKSPIMKIIDVIFDFLQSIALGGAFFVVIYLFVMQPHQVKGNSMHPTYINKQYILTDKISFKFRTPQRGEVIILKSPTNPDIDFIKRIIGLPGENLMVKSGEVYLNNQPLNEDYINVRTPVFPGGFLKEGVQITVPEQSYFVMGDNRPGSSDSREFGFVPFQNIVGKVFFRYYPINKFGLITKPSYQI